MIKKLALLAILLSPTSALMRASTRGQNQASTPALAPAPAAAKAPDYTNQPFVVEDKSTVAVYEEDGASTITTSFRARVQSQAGVQAFGVLQFPYASATQTVEVLYIRVIKPDKRVIETPAENALDMPAEITRQAPFYSDLKVLQVAVKGLEVGDTLDVQSRQRDTKPLDPGQFWNTFQFFDSGIVLQEEIEISVPGDRRVQVKSATVQPAVTHEGKSTVYRWKTARLQDKTEKSDTTSDGQARPSVQLTSFQSWDELGHWEKSLFAPRTVPTPEISAKEAELTRGARTDDEKTRDLYAFVSTKYRYIGISLGIGRVQPHAAADVMGNDYGDCKDKHTLFAALLAAAGIKAYPALVDSDGKMEEDVPSPAQFDHVITAIPKGNGYLFLDTTPEVAPFGYLMAGVRAKKVLVIPDSGPAELVETPDDPPFPSFFQFQADGTLDDTGTLESKMQMTMRGDAEVLYRIGFRAAGQSQWDTVMQSASQAMGFGGKVSGVTASAPDATDTPFHVAYNYRREKFSDWADKQITMALPGVDLPDVPDKTPADAKPVDTGSPRQEKFEGSIKLPAGFSTQAPAAVHLKEDFGDYDAQYSLVDHTLHVIRTLTTKEREIPPAQFEKLRQFEKAVTDDESTYIRLSNPISAVTAQPQPTSSNSEAQQFYQQGLDEERMNEREEAKEAFQAAANKDPQFAMAWIQLGVICTSTGDMEQGADAIRKAITINPGQEYAYNILAGMYMFRRRPEDALKTWRELEKAVPGNADAPRHAGELLMNLERYAEAVPELEAAVKNGPPSAPLLLQLGDAYAESGQKDKAVPVFEKALQLDSSAPTMNDAAFAFADANLKLDEALDLSQKAVSQTEAATTKIELSQAPLTADVASTLATFWDTLGWVHFRMEQLPEAERYIRAAWRLTGTPVIGDHLGQIYEKEGRKQDAIRVYEEASSEGHAPQGTAARLKALRPKSPSDAYSITMALEDRRQAKVKIAEKPRKALSAQFDLLFESGPTGFKIADAKFVSGDDELRPATKSIIDARFDFPTPDQAPARFLRSAVLSCDLYMPDCVLVLYPLATARPAIGQ